MQPASHLYANGCTRVLDVLTYLRVFSMLTCRHLCGVRIVASRTALAGCLSAGAGRGAVPGTASVPLTHIHNTSNRIQHNRINKIMSSLYSTSTCTDISLDNPLLSFYDNDLPKFDLIAAHHVVPAINTLLQQLTEAFNTYERDIADLLRRHELTYAAVVGPLESIHDRLQLTYGAVKHLSNVADSSELRDAIAQVEPEKVKFTLRVAQSEIVYNAMQTLVTEQKHQLTPIQVRVLQLQLLDAKQSGVGLKGADKQHFNSISERLPELSRNFNNHISDAVKEWRLDVTDVAELAGLSDDTLAAAMETARTTEPKRDNTYRFTLSQPVYVQFMNTCSNRALREQMYRAYVSKASSGALDNRPVMAEILYRQTQIAKLLGYSNYAEVSLDTKLVKSVDKVIELLEKLRSACYEKAVNEMSALQQFALQFDSAAPSSLQHWDINYYVYHQKQQQYQLPEDTLKQYLQFPTVIQALFKLLSKLFNIRISKPTHSVATWCPGQVEYFDVYDGTTQQRLASFFVDAYARPANKRGGAWFAECVSRRVMQDGSVRLPVGYLICNQPAPVQGKPSLMLWRDVETLWHEMGHTLQHLLTRVDENSVAGIRCVEWDSVELASQFMENFCYSNQVIDDMSRHVDTNQTLPVELRQALVAAKQYRAASDALRQLHFGLTDIKLYGQLLSSADVDVSHTPSSSELDALAQRMLQTELEQAKSTMLLQPIDEHYFLCSFSHIFGGGYAAGMCRDLALLLLLLRCIDNACIDRAFAICDVLHRVLQLQVRGDYVCRRVQCV